MLSPTNTFIVNDRDKASVMGYRFDGSDRLRRFINLKHQKTIFEDSFMTIFFCTNHGLIDFQLNNKEETSTYY